MSDDLAVQIRALCETTEPVTAAEAILRAHTGPTRPAGRHRRPRWAVAVGACFAAAACVAGIWSLSSGWHLPSRTTTTVRPRIVLTAARLDRIVRQSSLASATTGTARVTQTLAQNGTPQSRQSVAVTFDGANIDEKITIHPEPTGSAPPFKTDDRLVNGQFYIYTAGPSGVVEWLHDTSSANDVSSMQFPDPRTLYGAIAPAADFETVGTTTSGGTTLTHLRALDPAAIETTPLGNLAFGALSSFDLWVESNDVVRRMSFTSSATVRSCRWNIVSPKKLRALAPQHGKARITLRALHEALKAGGVQETCGPQTTTSLATASFANQGAPETVTPPPGAVDFQGKG